MSDILKSNCMALVNTVNCVGVMGKGLALSFKNKFPTMYDNYRKDCYAGKVNIGKMHVWGNGKFFVINFPTKIHWKNPSKLEYIIEGLKDLSSVILNKKITSLAIPPLGCGNGGLDWTIVKPIIVEWAKKQQCRFEIYEPTGTITHIPFPC